MKVACFLCILLSLITSCASVQEYQRIVDDPEDGFYAGTEEGRRFMMIRDTTDLHFVADSASLTMIDIESIYLQDHPHLSADAHYLTLEFSDEGRTKIARLTESNLNKYIYFVLGGKIISANLVMAKMDDQFCTFISVKNFEKLFKEIE
ncbi:MAG: hypothetical protein ACI837_002325 [Crocinitomicaceae bacterium]|jgi:hypothetical protein